ncbi:MAG: hypothetical protein GEV03_21720 [Streptosporangiales bacterium]|nr:hypothetical protein [Streptosporangiales bacterium]
MVITPDSSVPAVAPMLPRPPHTASARERRTGSGNTEPSSAIAAGAANAAPAPCTNRVPSSTPSPGANAAPAEAKPKTVRPRTSIRRRPSRSASRPPSRSSPPSARILWGTRHRPRSSGHAGAEADADLGVARARQPIALRRAYLLGLISNLTNPKMAVFFLTFLPQFVAPGPNATAQLALLGLLFNAMASTWWIVYVFGLERISVWLRHPAVRRTIERITGAVLVALGVRLATER